MRYRVVLISQNLNTLYTMVHVYLHFPQSLSLVKLRIYFVPYVSPIQFINDANNVLLGLFESRIRKRKKPQQILRNHSLKIKKCSNTVRSNLSLQPSGLIGFDHLRNPYSLNRKLIEGMEEIKTHRMLIYTGICLLIVV